MRVIVLCRTLSEAFKSVILRGQKLWRFSRSSYSVIASRFTSVRYQLTACSFPAGQSVRTVFFGDSFKAGGHGCQIHIVFSKTAFLRFSLFKVTSRHWISISLIRWRTSSNFFFISLISFFFDFHLSVFTIFAWLSSRSAGPLDRRNRHTNLSITSVR